MGMESRAESDLLYGLENKKNWVGAGVGVVELFMRAVPHQIVYLEVFRVFRAVRMGVEIVGRESEAILLC